MEAETGHRTIEEEIKKRGLLNFNCAGCQSDLEHLVGSAMEDTFPHTCAEAKRATRDRADWIRFHIAAFQKSGLQRLFEKDQADKPTCFGKEGECESKAEMFCWLANSPHSFCRECALDVDAAWRAMGFEAPIFRRLSDGMALGTNKPSKDARPV